MKRSNSSRNQGMENNGVSDCYILALPSALLLEIFAALPIFVWSKCKLVCRAWYELLTESSFMDFYERFSPFSYFLIPTASIKVAPDSDPPFLHLLEFHENRYFVERRINVKLPLWVERKPLSFAVGDSFNGFVCFIVFFDRAEQVIIINPLTEQYVELPEHEKPHSMTFRSHKIGFSPSNKMKVVRFSCEVDMMNITSLEKWEVFNVGVDSEWRCLSCFPKGYSHLINWIAFNGVLHGITEGSRHGSYQISTFDLGEEKFGKISHPPGLFLYCYVMKLVLFNHQLSVIGMSSSSEIAIWTMRKYGDVNSWTKDMILESWLPDKIYFKCPIQRLKNGDVLYVCSGSNDLFWLDVKQKRYSRIAHSIHYMNVMTFAPSFKLYDS